MPLWRRKIILFMVKQSRPTATPKAKQATTKSHAETQKFHSAAQISEALKASDVPTLKECSYSIMSRNFEGTEEMHSSNGN